jgi:hypothetical protein
LPEWSSTIIGLSVGQLVDYIASCQSNVNGVDLHTQALGKTDRGSSCCTGCSWVARDVVLHDGAVLARAHRVFM